EERPRVGGSDASPGPDRQPCTEANGYGQESESLSPSARELRARGLDQPPPGRVYSYARVATGAQAEKGQSPRCGREGKATRLGDAARPHADRDRPIGGCIRRRAVQ